jgi:glycosyltransferase involved in cell wall biosynthesis
VHLRASASGLPIHCLSRFDFAFAWRHWFALAVVVWDGTGGELLMRIAPLFWPPFRILVLNEHGDFFNASASNILRHWRRRIHDKLHPAAATAFAEARSWCCAPGRFLFHRLHGAEPQLLEARNSAGEGVAEWRQPDRFWRREGFARFLESTDARWILWRYENAPPAPDMSALHRLEPLTFVVSRQDRLRHWRRTLFARVPFRKLQTGGASQVLAPLSSSMLIDRCKLIALGLPRVKHAYVAWMILFWKAAAAGWRSYSVGANGHVPQRLDFPLLEARVIWQILADPELRRLGPAEPELSRGSIAFVPTLHAAAPAPSAKPRVVILSPFLPFPLSHGGAVRIYNLCRALRDRADFTLIAIREFNEHIAYPELYEVFARLHIIDLEERPYPNRQLPQQVRQHRSSAIEALLAKIDREWEPDLLQIEYTHMAHFREAVPQLPTILVEHDVTYTLYRQLAEAKPSAAARAEYRRWLLYETEALRGCDAVWTVSGDDRQRVMGFNRNSESIPNGVDIDWYRPEAPPPEPNEILYVGSLRHHPNVLGLEWLLDEIMPRLWEAHPRLRLNVAAGPSFEAHLPRRGFDARVQFHGFTPDLRPLYQRASAAVVPLPLSAGTNIKLLEAMACGRPVVSTSPGCQGLKLESGRELLIRDEAGGFAKAVSEILASPQLASGLARRARICVERHWSWPAQADLAFASYRSLIDGAGRRACGDRVSTAARLGSRSRK